MLTYKKNPNLVKHELRSRNLGSTGIGGFGDNKFYLTDKYILLANGGDEVEVKHLNCSEDKHVETVQNLKHNQPVTSIGISADSKLICTCSDESVILWKLEGTSGLWAHKTIAVEMGRICCCAICADTADIFVSLARKTEIVVIHCQWTNLPNPNFAIKLGEIEVYAESDKQVEMNNWLQNFHLGNTLHIAGLTSGSGVSLQIWEVQKNSMKLIFRIALQMRGLASADITIKDGEECYFLAMSPEGYCEIFIGGTKNGFCLLDKLKIESRLDNSLLSSTEMQVDFRVCSAHFYNFNSNSLGSGDCQPPTLTDQGFELSLSSLSLEDDKRDGPSFPKLLVCVTCTTAIFILNIRTGEIELWISYDELLQNDMVVISNAATTFSLGTGGITFAYQPLLQNFVCLLQIHITEDVKETSNSPELTLISSEPNRSKSVLRKKLKSPCQKLISPMLRRPLGYPIINTKIKVLKKSSFNKTSLVPSPRNNGGSSKAGKTTSWNSILSSVHSEDRCNYLRETLQFRENLKVRNEKSLSSGLTCLRLALSSDGSILAAGANLSPLVLFKTSGLKTLAVHRSVGGVTSVNFSFCSKYLTFAASDCSTRVINWKSEKELMKIQFVSKFNEHPHAQFYYMDKFLIQPEDNHLVFYSYLIKEPNWTKVKAGSFLLPCQQITAVAAANHFYSNLIICGLSNKSIQVFDANVEKVAASIGSSHSKNVTCIRINEAPKGVQAMNLCNFFLSSSPTSFDPVKLWDLRTQKCVSRISDINAKSFVSNSRPSLSPCGRYIASGFESDTVSLYDVRKINSRVTTLKCPHTTVLDCVFDRNSPMVWCGSREGAIWNYTT